MEQIAVMDWARWNRQTYPELELLHHIPNGGSRNKVEAAKMKRMGVVAGVPDLHLPVARGIYSSLWIEMKYDKGRIRPSQKEFMKKAASIGGAFCCVCYTAEDAIWVMEKYLGLDRYNNLMPVLNMSILRMGKQTKITTRSTRSTRSTR